MQILTISQNSLSAWVQKEEAIFLSYQKKITQFFSNATYTLIKKIKEISKEAFPSLLPNLDKTLQNSSLIHKNRISKNLSPHGPLTKKSIFICAFYALSFFVCYQAGKSILDKSEKINCLLSKREDFIAIDKGHAILKKMQKEVPEVKNLFWIEQDLTKMCDEEIRGATENIHFCIKSLLFSFIAPFVIHYASRKGIFRLTSLKDRVFIPKTIRSFFHEIPLSKLYSTIKRNTKKKDLYNIAMYFLIFSVSCLAIRFHLSWRDSLFYYHARTDVKNWANDVKFLSSLDVCQHLYANGGLQNLPTSCLLKPWKFGPFNTLAIFSITGRDFSFTATRLLILFDRALHIPRSNPPRSESDIISEVRIVRMLLTFWSGGILYQINPNREDRNNPMIGLALIYKIFRNKLKFLFYGINY